MTQLDMGWGTTIQTWPTAHSGFQDFLRGSSEPVCRGCGAGLLREDVFADLGTAPLANALLSADQLDKPEVHHRLLALVCRSCSLVQLPDYGIESQVLFPAAYPFRSGASHTWLRHCKQFAEEAKLKYRLGALSHVLEIGSNDGSGLLRFRGLGIPALGVEPCQEVAQEALRAGIATDIAWWTADYGRRMRSAGYKADLVLARNVLAHVPNPKDFLEGVEAVLSPGGRLVIEAPYVGRLIEEGQWDQIYHEHYCYFGLASLQTLLTKSGLIPYQVDQLPIHGGSIRVVARRAGETRLPSNYEYHLKEEQEYYGLETLLGFSERIAREKRENLALLIAQKERGWRIMGYGASAKAATLLNYCGIGTELIEAVVDITPGKQEMYLPGSRIPIRRPDALTLVRPESVVNFCWNWPEESEKHIRELVGDQTTITYLREHIPCPSAQ